MIIKKTKGLKIFNFLIKEYHINEQLKRLKREKVKRIFVKGETIAKMLFLCMFTRERSFNQLIEKIHKRRKYKNMFRKNEHIPKMHVFREGIKELDLEEIKKINKGIISKARENKIYRKGTIDNLVVAGIDGVETFGSYKKDWKNSYKTKKKTQEYRNGKKEEIEKEYHKHHHQRCKQLRCPHHHLYEAHKHAFPTANGLCFGGEGTGNCYHYTLLEK